MPRACWPTPGSSPAQAAFPRAHALASLACEELGKSQQCLRAVWLPRPPKGFWDAFTSHAGKLSGAHALAALGSGEPVGSPRAFGQQVRQASRAAHQRKLRGLYVGYEDGGLQLPAEITEREAGQVISMAQAVLDRDTASWAGRADQARWLARQPEQVHVMWVIFLAWVAASETDALAAVIRDGWSAEAVTDLLQRFVRHVEASGGRLPDPFAHEWLRDSGIFSRPACRAGGPGQPPARQPGRHAPRR